MTSWAERAKARFSKTCPPPTPKTPETPLLGVLGVPPQGVFEKSHGVLGVLGVPPRPVGEKANGSFGGFGGTTPAHSGKTATPAADQKDPAHHLIELAQDTAPTAPPPRPAPQGFDPGEAALQALAKAYCDRTGASDKARQDWQQDIASTPPELRPDLYAHLRAQLPPAPPRPAPAQPTRQPAPMAWSDVAQDWRTADRAYLAHWGTCPACQSAARHGARCEVGQQLHHTYLAALATTT